MWLAPVLMCAPLLMPEEPLHPDAVGPALMLRNGAEVRTATDPLCWTLSLIHI